MKVKIPKIIMPICDDNLFTLKMSSYLFDKYWPKQTEIDVIGFKTPDFEISSKMNFVSIAPKQEGGALSWSKYILSYLESIEDDQVIFMLEDFFPTKSPNIQLIKSVNNLLKSNKKIGRFDLTFDSYSFGKFTTVKKIKNLTIINKEKYTEYRITTQPSLWNRLFLIEILKKTTTPWDFEINGTKHSNNLDYQILAFGDETYENFPTYWIHKGAVSRQYPNKINVLGIDLETIKEMVENELFQESELVWGMWNHGKIPSFHELGGYSFDLTNMPINDASRSNWKEYRHVYTQKNNKEINMKKLCFICPSRNRLKKLVTLMDSFIKNRNTSTLYVVYDHDDLEYIKYFTNNENYLNSNGIYGIQNEINFNNAFLHIMNHYSQEKAKEFEMIGFLEDDCVIQTKNFDDLISRFTENVVYTNDLLNTPRIVSLPVLRSEIILKLGFYSPPEIKCLWGDYYWKMLGEETRSIKYLENVIISHEHYSVTGEAKDAISEAVDSIGNEDYYGYNNNLEKIKQKIRSLNE